MADIRQDGLGWDDSGLDLAPIWTREPSNTAIESVCRQRLRIDPNDACRVSFYAEGAFNKLYLVEARGEALLMRISLPVCPRLKTRGEVTTLRWLREHNTDVLLPKVVDFDDTSDSGIGFEWIIMELLPGSSAWRRWRGLSMMQKVFLTQRIAEFQAQLLRRGSPGPAFRGIGTLESDDGRSAPVPGQLVSDIFFMGEHIKYDVPRGPFRSSHDWLSSQLRVAIIKHEATLASSETDEDEKEDAENAIVLVKRLLALLPKIFPPIQEPCERTVLWHHDLGLNNILVDLQGESMAVIDWECVSAVPLWMAAHVPKFLRGRDRAEEPKREDYSDDSPPGSTAADPDPDDLDNEGKNQLYWIDLMEYETTQLRKIYHDKMRSLWPEWDLHLTEGRMKRDFYQAVVICFQDFFLKRTLKWVDKIEAGEFTDLDTVLENV